MDTKEQVISFIDCCEEIKSCKFIMATTKIKELLKTIVNCPSIYRLFEAVTKDFDYLSVKAKCLVTTNDGIFSKSFVILPKTLGERLAFLFCLLVEFDRETVNFNDFLRRYYPEEGSYYASYQGFCTQIIDSLAECIAKVFQDELSTPVLRLEQTAPSANAKKAELISAINISVSEEINYLRNCSLPVEDKESAIKILNGVLSAVKAENEELIDALVCGYNYFVLFNKCESDGLEKLLALIFEFVQSLNETV